MREGHATFVAGTILREAPGATLEARAVLDGNGAADSWQAAHAIVHQGRSGVDILNLSFSCITGDGQPPLALSTAIDLVSPDVIVVAAAGNHGRPRPGRTEVIDGQQIDDISKCVTFPAALDNVIAVGSVTENGQRAPYSPEGDWVDVQAHGDNVVSTFPNRKPFNGFAVWSGTSFAAGQVSGAIAAQTVPGRVTARDAWAEIYTTAVATSERTWPPVLAPRFFWQVQT